MFRVYSTKEFPGLQASTELTKVSAPRSFRFQTHFILCSVQNLTSILLDGVSVLIFGKPNEEDERGTREGVLAQSMHLLLLAKGNKWILKRLGILVRMVKYQTLKTITTTIKKKQIVPRHWLISIWIYPSESQHYNIFIS